MKNITNFIFLVCLILAGCNSQPQLNKGQNELVTIDIHTPSGWSLTIKQDGSGQVGFGSHAVDFAAFEKNTFDSRADSGRCCGNYFRQRHLQKE